MASQHRMGSRTVRRALKLLEAEGLVAVEERRGCRVLARAQDPDRGCPLAFVVSTAGPQGTLKSGFFKTMLAELQGAAGSRGWSLLGVERENRTTAQVVEHLRTARACGAIIDSIDRDLLEAVRKAGIPAVTADAWHQDIALDAVLQDGFSGGLQAASYLVGRGHRRIGWLGLRVEGDPSLQKVERFSGAVGGLAQAGIEPTGALRADVREGALEEAKEKAGEMLSRRDRPTAILALWQGTAAAVVAAAMELGLVLGKDLEMVGWSTVEQYESEYAPLFTGAPVQPAVIWSIRSLAEMCIARLAQRRAEPKLPVTKTRIPTSLKLPE